MNKLSEKPNRIIYWVFTGLEQLFLRPARNGAVLILKDLDEEGAQKLMETLPFYAIRKSIEILPLIKDPEM